MLAFEIEVDGQPIALIGKRDWAILNVIIGALRDTDLKKDVPTVELRLGGLTLDDSDGVCHHFRWRGGQLDMGDTITIKLVESDDPTPPDHVFRSDYQAHESKELRRQEYLRLKDEFEPQEGSSGEIDSK